LPILFAVSSTTKTANKIVIVTIDKMSFCYHCCVLHAECWRLCDFSMVDCKILSYQIYRAIILPN